MIDVNLSHGRYRCTHYFWLLCLLECIEGKEGGWVGGWVRLTEMDLVTGREHNLAKTPASQLEFMVENISIFVEYPI
jgi:hypothetical protein